MYKVISCKDNIVDDYYYNNLKDVYILITKLKKQGYKVTVIDTNKKSKG